MSLSAAGASPLGPTAAHAAVPAGSPVGTLALTYGSPVGTLALTCGSGQGASATATINDGALVDGDVRFYDSTTSGTTGDTDIIVGLIASPATTTDVVAAQVALVPQGRSQNAS